MSSGDYGTLPESPMPKSGLGRLAQSSRMKHLKTARVILFVVGILTIVVNGFLFLSAEQRVLKAAGVEGGWPAGVPMPDEVKQVIRLNQLIPLSAIAIGAAFVGFGFVIFQHPVPITILSLVIYVGSIPVYAIWAQDASILFQGILLKIVIIVCLFKALQAAIAFERERNK